MFRKVNIVPRWIIFIIDLACCVFSLFFAYFLRFNFNIEQIYINEVSRNVLIFAGINICVFFIIKTYSGIIRYTSAQDSFRILFSIIISNGLFFFANLTLTALNKDIYISIVILILNG